MTTKASYKRADATRRDGIPRRRFHLDIALQKLVARFNKNSLVIGSLTIVSRRCYGKKEWQFLFAKIEWLQRVLLETSEAGEI